MPQKRKTITGGAAALAAFASVSALPAMTMAAEPEAAPVVAAARAASSPKIKFEQYKLANGLTVILAPDKVAPVVAVSVTYDVGSRNERVGRSGFAHLFEHMLFQGSENVGKGEHILLVQANGGSMNGSTNQDRTNYYETLPANQLELGLFLEADRMRSLDVSQENLDNQRAVVQEEKRQSYDNRPYGQVQENLLALAYQNFAYQHTTIGSMADLDAASVEDVRAFFKTYYAPNNAALAVVGDFDTAKAKAFIEKYFGPIARQPQPAPVDTTEPSMFGGEKRKTLDDPLARQPQYRSAYRTVSGDHPDFYALSILGTILGGGRTSRLYDALVEKNLSLGTGAGVGEGRGPSLFSVTASLPGTGYDLDKVEGAIDAEIERIQTGGVTSEELTRAKTGERADAVRSYATALGKANSLSLYAIYFNDAGRVNTYLDKIEAVTADDVKRVAQKYLVKNNRVVIITMPAGAAAPAKTASAAPVVQEVAK